ncbi:hypothetical protein, partial [Salmonella enterica]
MMWSPVSPVTENITFTTTMFRYLCNQKA